MAASRTILIAGAGIGGLAAAKALADKGFRVVLYEQAERLAEAGAGIQLSPNATRALMALGVGGAARAACRRPAGRLHPAGRVGTRDRAHSARR